MHINWTTLVQSLVYLFLALGLILIQLLIPVTGKGALFSLFLLLGVIISSLLFAGKVIAAVTTPTGQPYPGLSAIATITAFLMIILETFLSLRLIINYLISIFPR